MQPTCGKGLSGSSLGEASSAANAVIGAVGSDHEIVRLRRPDRRLAHRHDLAEALKNHFAAEIRRRFRPVANERQNILAPFRRRRAHVDQRARAPEAVEPVEHVLGQERRERFDDGARGGKVAPRPFERRRAPAPRWRSRIPPQGGRPMRRPASFAGSTRQSRRCGGRLIKSRASGCASVAIISAASATLRVIGPATRPI